MLLITLLIVALAGVQGKILAGNCNTSVPVEKNFKLNEYLGLWYEMYRYEQPFQASMECVTANYISNNSNIIVFNQGVINKKLFGINGTAIVDPLAPSGEGKLIVTFPGNMSRSNYWVMKTNYKSYSLVYSCFNLNNTFKDITGWILSRNNFLSLNDSAIIHQTINDTQAMTGLDWNTFRHTSHDSKTCSSSSIVYPSFMLIMAFLLTKLF